MDLVAPAIAANLSSASWIRRMFEEGGRLQRQFGAEYVFDFSLGNPHLEPPAQVVDRLRDLANHPTPGMHRYMPNAGFESVRQKVAEEISRRELVAVPGSHIVMTSGAAAGLNVVFRSLVGPGDEVLLLAPIFAEYPFYVANAGGTHRLVETDERFEPDANRLAETIGPKTRALLVNSPNNPTGRVYPLSAMQQIAEVLRDASRRFGRPIVLVSDEPYRRVVYDGVVVPPLLPLYDHTIVVASFSKDLGLAGERIGYLAVSPRLQGSSDVLAALIFCLRTLGFVSAPAIWQLVIAGALQASVDVDAYQRNRDALVAGLTRIGYDVVPPEGAFFLFPRSPIPDDVAFIGMLQQEKVLAVPGQGFARAGYFRLSYAVDASVIPRSLDGFARAFANARRT